MVLCLEVVPWAIVPMGHHQETGFKAPVTGVGWEEAQEEEEGGYDGSFFVVPADLEGRLDSLCCIVSCGALNRGWGRRESWDRDSDRDREGPGPAR